MSPRHIGLLAALSAIWGGSYLLIKYALEDFSAADDRLGAHGARRVVLAIVLRGAVRGALADMRGGPLGGHAGVRGGGPAVHPDHVRRARGAVRLTAVLISPAALFVALFAPFIDPSERIDRRQGAGMLIGLRRRRDRGRRRVDLHARAVPRRAGDGRRGRLLRARRLRGQAPLRPADLDPGVVRLDLAPPRCGRCRPRSPPRRPRRPGSAPSPPWSRSAWSAPRSRS